MEEEIKKMTKKEKNRYRCHYFLKVEKDSWNGSFSFVATNDERAKRYALAWVREKNKWNKKMIEEGGKEQKDWSITTFQKVTKITII